MIFSACKKKSMFHPQWYDILLNIFGSYLYARAVNIDINIKAEKCKRKYMNWIDFLRMHTEQVDVMVIP
jgi:hypothetical protein